MIDGLVLAQFRPIILTVMGGDILPEQRFRGARTWLIKKMLDAADVITSKSSFIDEGLNRIGDYAHKIRRVTWGVDTQKFRPGLDVTFLRKRLNIQPDDLVVFCPRICQPFYNQHLIIQAFADFTMRSEPRIKFKLIVSELFADAAYDRKLRTLVAKSGLTEEVRFVGTIRHQEMPAYFNLADIMVAIPPSDGMPQSLYEAMACGTYPVLGNLRQYKELIQDGVNGRLVPVGDIRTLAEVIIHSALDPQQRERAAVINRQRIMEMADKDVQERLVNIIYDEVWQKYAMVSARN
jgi:glycosyltransferase involved in cell wall biosynthesis